MLQSDAHARAASISFRQLRLFESIGRLKSVRRAAEECNLSQPAVTQALAKLEEQVGTSLFDRRANGSYPNELGDILTARTCRFFAQVEDALIDLGLPGGSSAASTVAKRLSRTQIRSLVAVVDHGSFGAAAAAVGLSQASLQRAARDLEGNVRRPFFYRTAEGVMVTPAAAEFGRRMKLAVQEIELAITEIEAAQGSFNSRIVIGAMPFGGSVLLATVLDDFVRAYPNADLKIVNENAAQMLKCLRTGSVDFVLGLLPEKSAKDLVSEAVAETPYRVVCRRGHPILRKGKVTLDDLIAYDWVIGTEGSGRRACFERLFAGRKGPQASIAACALTVVSHLLARSDRLTLMTSYEIEHVDAGLTAVNYGPIKPAPKIGITTRANWLPTRMHEDFMQTVREHIGSASVTPLRKAG